MKQKILLLLSILLITMSCSKTGHLSQLGYISELEDSIKILHQKLNTSHFMISGYEKGLIMQQNVIESQDSIVRQLRDSLSLLRVNPKMSIENFIQLYKFERLKKYYNICRARPSQWKYYKGWTIRVMEQ